MKPLHEACILVVEDDQGIRDSIKEALQVGGCTVTGTDHGEAALQLIQQQKFDVIILDLRMPVMSGEEFIKRKNQRGDDTPIVISTALSFKQTQNLLAQKSVVGILNKPFDLEDMWQVIKRSIV